MLSALIKLVLHFMLPILHTLASDVLVYQLSLSFVHVGAGNFFWSFPSMFKIEVSPTTHPSTLLSLPASVTSLNECLYCLASIISICQDGKQREEVERRDQG